MKNALLFYSISFGFVLGFLMGGDLWAQQTSTYPELVHSYFMNPIAAVNRLNSKEKAYLSIVDQQYFNINRDVYLVDFKGYLSLRSKHQIGISGNSLKEGPYISKTIAALHYAFTVKVLRQSFISSGLRAGINSFKIDGSVAGVNGQNSTVPDLNLDLLFKNKHYFLYYSINQLLSSDIYPSSTRVVQKTFHETRVGFTIPLSRKIEFTPQGHIVLYQDRTDLYGIHLSLHAYSLISVGVATYNFTNSLYQLSIHLPETRDWSISFTGSYKQLRGKHLGSLFNNSMEVGLYFTKKKREIVHESEE